MFKKNLIYNVFYKINNYLPKFVIKALKYSVVLSFILSILDIFSLSLLIPVIQTIFEPNKLKHGIFLDVRNYFIQFDDLTFIMFLKLYFFSVNNYELH